MRRLAWLTLATVAAVATLAGCTPGRTRGTVVFVTIANILAAEDAEGTPAYAATETALPRLARTVKEINELKDVQFVVLAGNLVNGAGGPALDRVRSTLAELKKPYYVVLGPEALAASMTSSAASTTPTPAETSAPPPAATSPATPPPAEPAPPAAPGPPAGVSLLAWAFRDHGFTGPEPYWQAKVNDDLVLVALYSAAPGAGRPGHIDAAQLDWLDRTLKQYPDKAVIIFCYHALVPFHPFDETVVWEDRLVDNRRAVLETLGRYRNVLMVVTSSHAFAGGQVVGNVLHVSSPALSVWPLAYDTFKVAPDKVERQYVGVGTDDETRAAFDGLAADPGIESLFGAGEHSEQQTIQVFGGRKSATWNLNTVRP